MKRGRKLDNNSRIVVLPNKTNPQTLAVKIPIGDCVKTITVKCTKHFELCDTQSESWEHARKFRDRLLCQYGYEPITYSKEELGGILDIPPIGVEDGNIDHNIIEKEDDVISSISVQHDPAQLQTPIVSVELRKPITKTIPKGCYVKKSYHTSLQTELLYGGLYIAQWMEFEGQGRRQYIKDIRDRPVVVI